MEQLGLIWRTKSLSNYTLLNVLWVTLDVAIEASVMPQK